MNLFIRGIKYFYYQCFVDGPARLTAHALDSTKRNSTSRRSAQHTPRAGCDVRTVRHCRGWDTWKGRLGLPVRSSGAEERVPPDPNPVALRTTRVSTHHRRGFRNPSWL